MSYKLTKVIFVWVAFLPSSAWAVSTNLDSGPDQQMIFLTVDKSRSQAELKTLPENGQPSKMLRSFKIATGKVDGDKERQGDNKTPEGIYFTTGTIPSSQLAPQKYGPLAIPLNFPNPMDQAIGKTGYGIWLHGVGDRRIEDARVTEGCVAFQNSEITSLTRWLQPKQGVVVIARESSVVNRPEDVQGVFEVAKGWVDAWQNRDIERYISYYSKEFDSQGKDVDQYEAYKRSVFKSYKTMVVKMLDMRVVTHAKYSIVMMNQFFSGDNRFKSDGRKMIYLKKEQDGSWKIVRELFDNFLMRPVQFSNEDIAGLNKGASLVVPEKNTAVSATPSDNQSL